MNINQLHNSLKLKDTTMYCVFKSLINAYPFNTKYKLFNYYLFRTDCLKDTILESKSYWFYDNKGCIINDKINYRNKNVRKYVDENKQLYIGNVYSENSGFCPLFLSCTRKRLFPDNEWYSDISGYSVSVEGCWDQFYFDESTTKRLSKISENDMMLSISYASNDLKKRLETL